MSFIKYLLVTALMAVTFVGSFAGTRVVEDYMSYHSPRAYTHHIVSDHGAGSMVVLAPGLGLTAAHVTGPAGVGFTVEGKPIKILKYDATLDLTLFEVDLPCPCAPIGTLPYPDEKVVAVGYPLSAGQFATEGRIQDYSFKETRLETSVPIMFGNSGGPLFAFQDFRWKLVGIMVQVHGTNLGFLGVPIPTMSRAVPVTNILEFIHRASPIGHCNKSKVSS